MKKNWLIALLGLLSTSAIAQQGEWENPFFNFGNDPLGSDAIVAMHLIHVYDSGTGTGKVVAITYAPPWECAGGVGRIYLWTPPPPNSPGNPGQFQSIPNCHNYLFCAGHSALADGRILVAGSEWAYFLDAPHADLFDPNFQGTGIPFWNTPQAPPLMAHGRWYPTATTLPKDSLLYFHRTVVL